MYSYDQIRRAVESVVGGALSEFHKNNLAEGIWRQLAPDAVITLSQAARELGISARTVARMPDLPLIQLTPHKRGVRRSDLRKWVDAHYASSQEIHKGPSTPR